MVELATDGRPRFAASRIELDRPGPSYSVDTLSELAAARPSCDLFFVTGIDAVLDLPHWRDPEGLLRLARFIAVSRPGMDRERLAALVASLPPDLGGRIFYLPIPAVDVSSRDLRRRVRRGLPIDHLVPAPVAAYIAGVGLYAPSDRRA